MMYGSWGIKRFFSFGANPLTFLTTRKIKILKNWKTVWRYDHFTLVYHKWHHMVYAFWDMGCNRKLPFWAILCPFTLLLTPKIKSWKKIKNSWRYYPFTHVYHKLNSYDGWFLRYKVQYFFVILGLFLSLTFLTSTKIKILKMKKSQERLSFYT